LAGAGVGAAAGAGCAETALTPMAPPRSNAAVLMLINPARIDLPSVILE
jgi:hypothetical protein